MITGVYESLYKLHPLISIRSNEEREGESSGDGGSELGAVEVIFSHQLLWICRWENSQDA